MKKDFLRGGEELSPKVKLLFTAVIELLNEGADVNNLKISDITTKAGIGKGTAYDYFKSKEEVIGAGIIYYVGKFMADAESVVLKLPTFKEGLNHLFDVLEKNLDERGCFIRLIHLLMGTSPISLYMQEAIRNDEAEMPLVLLDKMIQKGMDNGELSGEYPISYVVYTICARILTYATLLDIKSEERPMYSDGLDKKQIRELMIKGIMSEFGA